MKRINFMGCPMDISTMEETVDEIIKSVNQGKFIQHVVVNVAKIVNMRKDPELNDSVRACDIINIDGMGVVFGARFLGYNVAERVAGVDLFTNLITRSEQEGLPIFLLGARDEVVSEVVRRLQRKHPNLNLAGYHHGYFWDDEEAIVNKIRESGARMLFVAITSPRKENFINRWKDQLGIDFVMGVGGTFDVVAGKVKRAPKWMQDWGLEWLYRIIQEPKRMWKRYFLTNSAFLWLLIKARLGMTNRSR